MPVSIVMHVTTLLAEHRIFCPTRESFFHLLRVTEFAGREGRLDQFTERLNYIAPREDETIVLSRDGRPNEMSFFWQQITRDEHAAAMKACGVEFLSKDYMLDLRGEYRLPSRSLYHGGLIYRGGSKPIDWTVHT